MPSTLNAVNNHEYRSVPITALAESATNPRKRFDAKSLEELAASFKTQGILAPLLVRELEESKYEVVAGARRLRAAKLAELEKLPVRVVKLTDAEAIEAQCVENLQREDIHPLEEALGFKSLLELGEPAYTIATIASRAGKSEAYVYGLCSQEHKPYYVVLRFMWSLDLTALCSAPSTLSGDHINKVRLDRPQECH